MAGAIAAGDLSAALETRPAGAALPPVANDQHMAGGIAAGDLSAALETQPAAAAQRLLKFDQLPDWARDNELIGGGYRQHPTESFRLSARSIFALHNETLNIWTHLSGLLAFAGVFASLLARARPATGAATTGAASWSAGDYAAWGCFCAGCLACLGFSTCFHVLMNHSEAVHRRTITLDYVGIVLLIWGSHIVATHFLFWCDSRMQAVLMAAITAFGAAVITTMLVPRFMGPRYRVFRAALFASMGASGIFPIGLFAARHAGCAECQHVAALFFGMLGAYAVGVVAYALRFPECVLRQPGRLDVFGGSHQWLHVAVLGGCALHYQAAAVAMARVHDAGFACAAAD
jgi:adiponectin receptor